MNQSNTSYSASNTLGSEHLKPSAQDTLTALGGITFCIAIFVIVMAVTLSFMVEYPLGWYLSTEVTHTTYGITTTTGSATGFHFHYQLDDGSYQELHIVFVILLGTLFYLGLLLAILNALKILKVLFTTRDRSDKPLSFRALPTLLLLLAISPYYIFQQPEVRGVVFAGESVQLPPRSQLVQILENGDQLIWQAAAASNYSRNPIIQNNRKVSEKSSLIQITAIKPNNHEKVIALSLHAPHTGINNLRLVQGKDHMWAINNQPFFAVQINADGSRQTFDSPTAFIAELTGQDIEVYKQHLKLPTHMNIVSVLGEKYQFVFSDYALERGNQQWRKDPKQNLSGNFTLRHKGHQAIFGFENQNWQHTLLKPIVLFSNSQQALIAHNKRLGDSLDRNISLISNTGDILWQTDFSVLNHGESPINEHVSEKDKRQSRFFKLTLTLDNEGHFIISSAIDGTRAGNIVKLEKTSGETLWQL